jgi:hypothetical protein
VQARRALAELTTPPIKFAVWSPNGQFVALLGKETLVICNRQVRRWWRGGAVAVARCGGAAAVAARQRTTLQPALGGGADGRAPQLEQLATLHETMRIKSAVWDDSGVLVYNTTTHLKYSLANGDAGIIRTLDVAVYAAGRRMHGRAWALADTRGRTATSATCTAARCTRWTAKDACAASPSTIPSTCSSWRWSNASTPPAAASTAAAAAAVAVAVAVAAVSRAVRRRGHWRVR